MITIIMTRRIIVSSDHGKTRVTTAFDNDADFASQHKNVTN